MNQSRETEVYQPAFIVRPVILNRGQESSAPSLSRSGKDRRIDRAEDQGIRETNRRLQNQRAERYAAHVSHVDNPCLFYSPFKSSSSRRTVIFIGFPSLTISSFLVRLSLILTALSNDKSFRVNPFIATISSPFCKPASL